MQISKTKILSVFIIGLFFGASIVPGITGNEVSTDDIIKEIVLVRTCESKDIKHLETIGANIIEIYEQYVLIEIASSMMHQVKEMSKIVEKMENYDYVGLQAYSFNVSEGTPDIPKHLDISSYSDDIQGYYIVQFIGPIKPGWQEELIEKGARIHEFRHKFNLIAEMDSSTKNEVEKLYYVNWVGIYQPAYKFDLKLLEETGSLLLNIIIFDARESSEIAENIMELGGDIQYIHGNRINIEINSENIPLIARLHNINSITKAAEEYYIFNDDATWITQTNEFENRKVTDSGITGLDQIITVMDSELYGGNSNNPDHEMWVDPDGNPVGENHRKIVEHYVPVGSDGDLDNGAYHGTHVVGTVLGDSPPYNTYSNHDGNGLEARLIFQDIDYNSWSSVYPPDNMYGNAWTPSYTSDSRVHTNSWGGWDGYDGWGLDGDQFIWNHKDYNILFAMGNAGSSANTLNQQAEGKNIISVGGVTNYPDHNTMYSSSSRGYADDGRIKPTILHVAQYVTSASQSTSGYSSLSGTSMATPGIAGQVGQIRQYYEEGWYPEGFPNPFNGFNPSNALVRATLINGAVEITGSGAYQNGNRFPNGDQGYGR
ncbi:MAG: S8 family serine peptidase, partial [Candidatus Thermoplasmatota archaeon]|nr:S8 family serine peptidase [Candidatus Thermoplasmatota archaeon]